MHCPECQHRNPSQAKFCMECGTVLAARAEPATGRAPRDYTPRHLAERILKQRSAIEGERKQVTVLFADVRGSLDLAEQVDAEQWHSILDGFFSILAAGVHRFEGTVNQYTGDGIMALFGAPLALEDHAQRACYAALHLRDELRGYAEELARTRGLAFSVRMGLNSGDVVVGKIGDDLRMDYTAQGHTVGLASRIEQLAAPGAIHLTEHTAASAAGYFELRDLGRFDLRGVRDPVRVFELERAGPLETRLDVARARGLSAFVSRQSELERLEAALEEVGLGGGGVVGIRGEPGVGKSRLCFEFGERCRARGSPVAETYSVSHGRAVPLLPWQRLLRDFAGVDDEDEPEVVRVKITGSYLRVDPSLGASLPLVFEVLGVPDAEHTTLETDPEVRREQLLQLIAQLMQARSRDEPAVLIWEDLHWSDETSDALLAGFVARLVGGRTLLVANFRPEYRAPWMEPPHYSEISLAPLDAQGSDELLAELLGDHPELRDLAEQIWERTRGNPFFIEEVVRSLVESGQLDGRPGAYRPRAPLERIAVPDSVRVLLASRIDALADRDKRVLQTAAVVGRRFSTAVLARLLGQPESELGGTLGRLVEAGMLQPEALFPQMEYAFRHPLTQDVAYASQLGAARARVHRDAARALRSSESEPNAALVAHHLEGAGDRLEAARWHARAAQAAGIVDVHGALAHLSKVRELLRALPESEEAVELRALACWQAIDVGVAGKAGITTEEARSLFDEGRALAERRGDAATLARLHASFGTRLGWSGDLRGSRRQLAAAAAHAREQTDLDVQLTVTLRASVAEMHGGALRDALALVEGGLARIADASESDGASRSALDEQYRLLILTRSNLLQLMGRLDEGAALLDRFRALASAAGTAHSGARNHHTFALFRTNLEYFRGNGEAALRLALEFVALAERTGSTWAGPVSLLALGRAYLIAGRAEPAVRAFDQSLALAREHRLGLDAEASQLAGLARAQSELGDGAAARRIAMEAVESGRVRGTRVWEIEGHSALAAALLAGEGAAARGAVEAALERAEALVEETGAHIMRPFLREQRAELLHLAGDDAGCAAERREAQRLWAAMGAHANAKRLSGLVDASAAR